MSNEKGVTLLEVMAAVTILTFMTSAAIMLFSAVHFLWNNSVQKQSDQFQTNFVVYTISKEMAATTEIYYAADNELRFKTWPSEGIPKYEALIYSAADRSLTLYNLNHTTELQNVGSYAEKMRLATNIQAFSVKNAVGTPLSTAPPAHLKNGELISVSVTFENARITVNGQKMKTKTTIDTQVKLISLPVP